MKIRHLVALFSVFLISSALAQDDAPVSPKEIVKEIEAGLENYQEVSASATFDEVKSDLTGWVVADFVHKIVAKADGEDSGVYTFYLDRNQPIAVLHSFEAGKTEERPAKKVEETMYFKDGSIDEWITDEAVMGAMQSEDYQSMTEYLTGAAAVYVDVLSKQGLSDVMKAAKTVEGTFTGFEEGDYVHWNMTANDGKDVSFFILAAYRSVDEVYDNPGKFKGKKCRVYYKTATEEIPEAGGEMEIDTIIAVEWL